MPRTPALKRGPLIALDLAMLIGIAAGAARFIRSHDLPPLSGMAPVFGTPWTAWSRLPFWLSVLAAAAWLAPAYLRLTGRMRKRFDADNLQGWLFVVGFFVVLPFTAFWLTSDWFGYAEAGDGVIEVQGPWPLRERFRRSGLRSVNAIRNSGRDEDGRDWVSWWVELETADNRRLESLFLESSEVPTLAARLSSWSDLPIRWHTEYQHGDRRPSTPEDVLRPGP